MHLRRVLTPFARWQCVLFLASQESLTHALQSHAQLGPLLTKSFVCCGWRDPVLCLSISVCNALALQYLLPPCRHEQIAGNACTMFSDSCETWIRSAGATPSHAPTTQRTSESPTCRNLTWNPSPCRQLPCALLYPPTQDSAHKKTHSGYFLRASSPLFSLSSLPLLSRHLTTCCYNEDCL